MGLKDRLIFYHFKFVHNGEKHVTSSAISVVCVMILCRQMFSDLSVPSACILADNPNKTNKGRVIQLHEKLSKDMFFDTLHYIMAASIFNKQKNTRPYVDIKNTHKLLLWVFLFVCVCVLTKLYISFLVVIDCAVGDNASCPIPSCFLLLPQTSASH